MKDKTKQLPYVQFPLILSLSKDLQNGSTVHIVHCQGECHSNNEMSQKD